jgi:hypothetical protein
MEVFMDAELAKQRYYGPALNTLPAEVSQFLEKLLGEIRGNSGLRDLGLMVSKESHNWREEFAGKDRVFAFDGPTLHEAFFRDNNGASIRMSLCGSYDSEAWLDVQESMGIVEGPELFQIPNLGWDCGGEFSEFIRQTTASGPYLGRRSRD